MVAQATPWNGRGTFDRLKAELERQRETRHDFVIDGRQLEVLPGEKSLLLAPAATVAEEWLPREGLPFSHAALGHLGGRLTPKVRSDFLRELCEYRPETAARLVNDLLHANAARHLVRCLDNRVRAVLSNGYLMVDNYDVALMSHAVVQKEGGEVIECSLTENNMRLKFTTRAVWDVIAEQQNRGVGNHEWLGRTGWSTGTDLPGGPGTVHPVVEISNSETGAGRWLVTIGILRAICVNTAKVEDVVSRQHRGERLDVGVYAQETISASNKADLLKVRDLLQAAFQPAGFKRLVGLAQDAAADPILLPPAAIVATLADHASLSKQSADDILAYFLRDYDQNRYGLVQAVARHAQDLDDGDKAAELESLAGRLLKNSDLLTGRNIAKQELAAAV